MPQAAASPDLSRFVTASVILENLQIFREECEEIRRMSDSPDLRKLVALAAFHEAVAEAIGLEDSEYRADRMEVLQRKTKPTMDFAPTLAQADEFLETMRFRPGNDLSARPSVRCTGSVARLSKLLERPRVSAAEGVKTTFSTYSPKSAW